MHRLLCGGLGAILVVVAGCSATDRPVSSSESEELEAPSHPADGVNIVRWERTEGSGDRVTEVWGDPRDTEVWADDVAWTVEMRSDGEESVTSYAAYHATTEDLVRTDPVIARLAAAAERADEHAARMAAPHVADLSALLETRLADADEGERAELIISLTTAPRYAGDVVREAARRRDQDPEAAPSGMDLALERLAELEESQQHAVAQLETEFGARVLAHLLVSDALLVDLPLAEVAAVRELEYVRRIETDEATELLGIDAIQTRIATQIDQYLTAGYRGGAPNPTRHSWGNVALGVADNNFEDDFESITDARIAQRWSCSTQPCTSQADLNSPLTFSLFNEQRHGTAVAQLAGGRAPEWFMNPTYAPARSGSSTEGSFVLAAHCGTTSAFLAALDRMAGAHVDVLTSSSAPVPGPDCSGTTSVDLGINALGNLFGVFFVQAAGNEQHPPGSGCNVRAPAAAAWAFPVGGLLDEADFTPSGANAATVQSGAIYTKSSRGGQTYLGGTRSVIATTATSAQLFRPDSTGYAPPSTTSPYYFGGTSYAAPQIAGSAVDIRDYWLTQGPGLGWTTAMINDPGFMAVQMSMMGDRQSQSSPTARLTAGYDDLFGNGRFRARLFTTAGLDDPSGFGTTVVNVAAGSATLIPINASAALPTGVDRLVVAAWWPEPNIGSSAGADIVVDVESTCGSPALAGADYSFDTRKRVVFTGTHLGGRCMRIRVTPFSTPVSDWNGIANRRLYVAWYYEDEARDDLSPSIQ